MRREIAEVADRLNEVVDVELIEKFVLTVLIVLLGSWAYSFCESRGRNRRRLGRDQQNRSDQRPTESAKPPGTCIKCKVEVHPKRAQPLASTERGRNGWAESSGSDRPEGRAYPATGYGTEVRKYSGENCKRETGEQHKCPPENFRKEARIHHVPPLSTSEKKGVEPKYQPATFGNDISRQREFCPGITPAANHAEVLRSAAPHPNLQESKGRVTPLRLSRSLSPSISTEQGRTSPTSPTGRRSPCTLQKLEQSGGVLRELRQDLGHPGAFSSFQSKVEIRVEDANLLLERPGNKQVEVRGKIYDFYAESSSQASDYQSGTNDLSPTAKQYEDCASLYLQPRVLPGLPAMGGDRCTGGRIAEQPVAPGSRNPPQITRDVGREDSSPKGSPVSSSPDHGLSPQGLANKPPTPTESKARVSFSQTPPEGNGSLELESLMGRLGLGNCLQALTLAREQGHPGLEKSALRVLSDNYLQVLQEPELYESLNADDREEIRNQRMKGRQYVMVADIDPQDLMRKQAASETSDSGISSGLYYYDDYEDNWHHMSSLPKEVVSNGWSTCTMDNYLFVAEGCKGVGRNTEPSRRVFCFNPATGAWAEICRMNVARQSCKLVALLGHVYAIGGEGLWSVERYSPREDRWIFVAPLPSDAFMVADRATSCNGELFVLGGSLQYTLLRYSPQRDAWRQSLVMSSKETTAEMVAVGSSLYRFDVSPTLGITVHRSHAVARLWYECCSKRLPYCPAFQCAAIDDAIYCVSRDFTLRLLADKVSPSFDKKDLSVLSEANGVLFPFTLVLPDKETLRD